MEDRLLFKAKRVDNGEWVVGYLYRLSEKYLTIRSWRKGNEYETNIV